MSANNVEGQKRQRASQSSVPMKGPRRKPQNAIVKTSMIETVQILLRDTLQRWLCLDRSRTLRGARRQGLSQVRVLDVIVKRARRCHLDGLVCATAWTFFIMLSSFFLSLGDHCTSFRYRSQRELQTYTGEGLQQRGLRCFGSQRHREIHSLMAIKRSEYDRGLSYPKQI
jgi:hypothetical protein